MLIRSLFAAVALVGVTSPAHAQSSQGAPTIQDYIKIRKKYGIVRSVPVSALEALFGTRVYEVQGTIKGSLKVGNTATLLLEKTDDTTMFIDTDNVPDWLTGDNVSARLIIRATRTKFEGTISTVLLAAAPEDEIEPIEANALISMAKSAPQPRQAGVPKHANAKYTSDMPASHRIWILPVDKAAPYYAAYAKHRNPRLSNQEAIRIGQGVAGLSKKYGVDATLIMAMIVCESDFNPRETSKAGAMGLGQLMPETAQDYGITNPYDTMENLYGTVREIRSHLEKYRNETGDDYQALVLALAAYNAGEGAVKRHGGVPPYRETQAYVQRVINLYKQWHRRS